MKVKSQNIKDEMFNLFDSYENCEILLMILREQESNGSITEDNILCYGNWNILNEWGKGTKIVEYKKKSKSNLS